MAETEPLIILRSEAGIAQKTTLKKSIAVMSRFGEWGDYYLEINEDDPEL